MGTENSSKLIARKKPTTEVNLSMDERRELIREQQNSEEFQREMAKMMVVRATPHWLLRWGHKKKVTE